MAVIDASVYITLIHAHETEHVRSWAWFQEAKAAEEPIRAPVILLAEVAAALSRGAGDLALARRAVQQVVRYGVIELVPVSRGLAERAAQIAVEHRIRGCDAVYVALAARLGECLVTLDGQQLERGAAVTRTCRPGEGKAFGAE